MKNEDLFGFFQAGLGQILQGSRDAEYIRLTAHRLAKTIRANRKRSVVAAETLEILGKDLNKDQLNDVLKMILETLSK